MFGSGAGGTNFQEGHDAANTAAAASGSYDNSSKGNSNTSSNTASNSEQEEVDDALDRGGVQGITVEEEMREFSALSAEELVAVQADLIGLSTAMGSLNLGQCDDHGSKRIRAQQQQHNAEQFERIAEELGRLSPEETAACRRALELCPDQVLDPRRIQMFLDYASEEEQRKSITGRHGHGNGGNIAIGNTAASGSASVQAMAASQLAQYWRAREKFFNNAHPNTAFLPMTQAGALTAAGAMHLTTRRIWQLLPQADISGRSIFLFVPSRKDYTEHTFYDELAGLWYLLETVMEDPLQRKRGFVMLMDLRGYTRQHTSRGAFLGLAEIFAALPISLKAVHACYPSALVNHVIFPLIKRLSPKEIRLRTVLHSGSVNEVLTSLSGYCLPPECVPTELGGQLVVDSPSWMLNRLAAETVQINSSIGTAAQNDGSDNLPHPISNLSTEQVAKAEDAGRDDGDNSSNKKKAEDNDTDTPPPKIDHYPDLTDRQLYERIVAKKEKAHGRKGDPRMNQALLFCLDDQDLPHIDALLHCGFDFSPLSREELEIQSSRVVKDVENITLKQRLDQLSRRLRTATKWIKVERGVGKLLAEPATTSFGEIRSSTAGSDYSDTSGDTPKKSQKHCEQTEKKRRDSFDEAIEELPGIQDLGDTAIDILSDEE